MAPGAAEGEMLETRTLKPRVWRNPNSEILKTARNLRPEVVLKRNPNQGMALITDDVKPLTP